jgi:ribonuclease BN (tRNA processing enzyme)
VALVVGDRIYVVDCGRSAVTQFKAALLQLTGLKAIFITHLHADHAMDFFDSSCWAASVSTTATTASSNLSTCTVRAVRARCRHRSGRARSRRSPRATRLRGWRT